MKSPMIKEECCCLTEEQNVALNELREQIYRYTGIELHSEAVIRAAVEFYLKRVVKIYLKDYNGK